MAHLRDATAVVIPSLWENFPNTCIEAMALGKVVVASKSGGQAEMVGDDGVAGLLFSHDEAGNLEASLKQALSLDEKERRRMGQEASRRIGELCNPDDVLDKRMTHYADVIASCKPREYFPFTNQRLREGKQATPLGESALVSVVVPYYNLGKYLMECIDSIYTTQGVDFEVVVVNDGSNDPMSLKVLEELRGSNRPGLRILDIANGGLANARNIGARHAE